MTEPHDGTAWREGGGVIAWPEGNRVIGHLYFIFFVFFFVQFCRTTENIQKNERELILRTGKLFEGLSISSVVQLGLYA